MSANMHPTSILTLDDLDKKIDQITHRGTPNFGLWFKKYDKYMFKSYYDANYAGDKIEKKSINGDFHFIGANLVSYQARDKAPLSCPLQK
ncbi:hypothetical protein CR513_30643, partial [Mucuna pruriens]